MEAHILDNPIWHMLCHDLAEFTVGTALAKRCDPNVFPTVALANHSDAALTDLANLFHPGETNIIVEINPPQELPGFAISTRFSLDQMVCQQRTPVPEHDIEIHELTPSDSLDAAQLIALTEPGPFFPGLLTLRRFIGIRQDGQLVAMAGERTRPPGYGEVSAVCTHPDWRARGYARLLSSIVANDIWARGDTPIIHVFAPNTTAYRVYERLHFVKRCELGGIFFTRI